jgi:pimeloyl-ACP methyl ester carboxylesterase
VVVSIATAAGTGGRDIRREEAVVKGRRLGWLVGFLFAVAALAAQPASAAPPQWGPCPGPPEPALGQECAIVPVPLDYSAPGGRTIDIAVSRLRATNPATRRGVLLLNPGGPGGSGLPLPGVLAQVLPQSVLERYDLIGFDPRGVGSSAPVTCALTPEQMDPTLFIPWPAPDGGIDGNIAYSRGAALSCAKAPTAGLLPFITTANTARDMDRIRAALGEPKISYLGYSYGTYLGAVYTSLFPARSDRIVLDSNVHPGRIWREVWRAWGPAIEGRFPDFTSWAAERDATYGLGATSDAVRRTWFALASRLDGAPVTLPDGTLVTGNVLREGTRGALYTDAAFPDLAAVLQFINEGGGAERLPAAVAAAVFPPVPEDNAFASAWAVTCDDAQWPESPDLYRRDVAIDRKRFPVAGGMAANIWPCAFWPVEPRERPVTIGGPGPRDVLVVQGLRDPATPYDGGVAMRRALGDRARLISVDVGGHAIAYGINANVNGCADEAVTSFLVTGQLPRNDVFCPREQALSAEPRRTLRVVWPLPWL